MIVLWGSNARETHPIFFHHVLKAVHNGAKLFVVDPRRTASAKWADTWLGLDVGTDVALANAIGARDHPLRPLRHGVHRAGRRSASRSTPRRSSRSRWPRASGVTGVPAEAIRELAHTYARADRAIICWTLGITEHHNAVDNVLALINLALLTGHVGRYGSGLNPLRGQNNVQGGGDMGAIPNKLPGFQDIENDDAARAKVRSRPGARTIVPKYGWHLTKMFEAMERGELSTLYVIGENPARSEADVQHTPQAARRPRLPDRAGHLPDRDRQDRRRGAARIGLVGRGRRHGHELASAACSSCARRSIRPATPATTTGSSSSSPSGLGTTGATRRPRTPGRSCGR